MKMHMNLANLINTVETYENNMFDFDALNSGFDMPMHDAVYTEKPYLKHKFKRLRV